METNVHGRKILLEYAAEAKTLNNSLTSGENQALLCNDISASTPNPIRGYDSGPGTSQEMTVSRDGLGGNQEVI